MTLELCPVCKGRQLLPHNFYDRSESSSSTNEVQCRSCGGIGYIKTE